MSSAGDAHAPAGDLVGETAERLVAAVPAPRPEVLARVLAGLRDLPDAPPRGDQRDRVAGLHPGDTGTDAALPRRRA